MNLNPFEIEILRFLCQGKSQKELAVKYNVPLCNISNVLNRARERNKMSTTIQMALEAYKTGLL